MTLAVLAAAYIAVKRAAGIAFVSQAKLVRSFAAFADARADRFVRVATVLDWASMTPSSREKRKRLHVVRGLAIHLHAEDERHEVPHRDALGRTARHRPPPCLPSPEDVRRIMDAALDLPPPGSITPVTVHYILGLMAATGLRRSEAAGLQLDDITPDGLRIRNAKGGLERLVPIHDSVQAALDRYLDIRIKHDASSDHAFILATGRPVSPGYLTSTFIRLARSLGIRGGPGSPGVRLHDLRHAFAVRALENSVSADRRDASRHMLALSTYLGHRNLADTYWYLEATPVLLRKVSATTGRLHGGRRIDD